MRSQARREQEAERLAQCVRLARQVVEQELRGMEHSWAMNAAVMGLVLAELLRSERG